MIYLYGIVDVYEPVEYFDFDNGRRIEILPHLNMGAAISTVSSGELQRNEENLLAHNGILMELANNYTVLPVQFGTVLKSRKAVMDLMSRHGDQFSASLKRLKGKVEMGVKVLWKGPELNERKCEDVKSKINLTEDKNTAQGKNFLMTRYLAQKEELHLEQRAAALGAGVNKAIAVVAEDSHHRIRPQGNLLLNGAYLLPVNNIVFFKDNVMEVKNVYSHLKFLISGPWPPYNFVRINCF